MPPPKKNFGLVCVLSVVLSVVCVWNDPSRVPTAAVKSRVTTYMYRRATNYMSPVTSSCQHYIELYLHEHEHINRNRNRNRNGNRNRRKQKQIAREQKQK